MQLKRVMTLLFTPLVFMSTHTVAANWKDTNDVKIKLISVWTANGDVLIQTEPRHNISGLNCTNDYWLTLNKNEPGFQATLSMLLSAQATQKPVLVRAQGEGGEFCRLTRVITKAG